MINLPKCASGEIDVSLYKSSSEGLLRIILYSSLAIYTTLALFFAFSRLEELQFLYAHFCSFLIVQSISVIGIRLHLNSLSFASLYSVRSVRNLYLLTFILSILYLASLSLTTVDLLFGNMFQNAIKNSEILLQGRKTLHHSLLHVSSLKQTLCFGQFASYCMALPIALIGILLLSTSMLRMSFEKPYSRFMMCLLSLVWLSTFVFLYQWFNISFSLPQSEWNMLTLIRDSPIVIGSESQLSTWILLLFVVTSLIESQTISLFEDTDESIGAMYFFTVLTIIVTFILWFSMDYSDKKIIDHYLYTPAFLYIIVATTALQLYSSIKGNSEATLSTFLFSATFTPIFLIIEICVSDYSVQYSLFVIWTISAVWGRLYDVYKENIEEFYNRNYE